MSDDCFIGANAFVAKDVAIKSVVAAPLATKISDKGSKGTFQYRK